MKCDETRKTKQNNKTVILEKVKEPIMSEEVYSKGVEDLSKNVDNLDDAAELIGRIERIMKSKKNNILMLAYHQGLIFKKYKENNKFMSAITKFKIHKTIINFKISIINFLKNNFRVIRDVCKEYALEFQ